MNDLGFEVGWVPAYSPEYNSGIENTWSMVKLRIKQKRIRAILKGENVNLEVLVEDVLNSMDNMKIRNAVVKSLNKIKD